MRNLLTLATTATLCLSMGFAAQADGSRAEISDQSYKAGKYSGGARQSALLANCPREYLEMYRGDLYCRAPERQVLAYRHRDCPEDVWGLYRGNLYCFGRR